ncbi:sporulation histidine kinase inhibitor Sda [Virgibacillus necropolis]
MNIVSYELLLEANDKAKKLNLNQDFIALLVEEVKRRD